MSSGLCRYGLKPIGEPFRTTGPRKVDMAGLARNLYLGRRSSSMGRAPLRGTSEQVRTRRQENDNAIFAKMCRGSSSSIIATISSSIVATIATAARAVVCDRTSSLTPPHTEGRYRQTNKRTPASPHLVRQSAAHGQGQPADRHRVRPAQLPSGAGFNRGGMLLNAPSTETPLLPARSRRSRAFTL